MIRRTYSKLSEDTFKIDSENIHECEIIQQCFDVVESFVVAVNLKGNITFANLTAAEILGYNRSEIIGLNFIKDFIVEKKQDSTEKIFELLLEGKKINKQNTTYFLQDKAKKQHIIESKVTIINGRDSRILGLLISGTDITNFFFKQKELKIDLSLYRLLANNIPDINLFMFDENLEFILAEGNEMKNNDMSRDDFEEKKLHDLPFKDLLEIWIPLFESALNGNRSSCEYQFNNYYYNIWVLPLYTDKKRKFAGIAITQNITEEKQIERQYKRSKEEADRANQYKTDFLARVSHEIRTPLNAILGFSEQLSQSKLESSQKEYVDVINKSSEHLLNLINDILVLSKIEAGQIRFDKSPFKLKYTIEYLYKTMLLKARQKQLNFTYTIDNSLNIVLIGDQFRLRQILLNLLNNAIKFTNSGSVKLNCVLEEETNETVLVRFDITDTGIGINPKSLPSIFKRFKQADSSIAKTYGGTGLGLPICKQLIELQAGKLSVSSRENVGTKFTFTIPYKKGQIRDLVFDDQTTTDYEILRNKRVLLVDDDNFNRILAKTILEKFGCKISIAFNGVDAIKYIDEKQFDIILLDIHMSDVSGLDVAKYIRNTLRDRKTKILAVTAAVLKDDINRYFRIGINDFLIKPFKEIDLFNKMCKVLNIINTTQKKNTAYTTIDSNLDSLRYDLSEVKKMAEGNQDFVNSMIITFIDNTEDAIQLFHQYLNQNKWKQIGETAHKMIPSYRHLKVYDIVNKLIDLENSIMGKDQHDEASDLTKSIIVSMKELLSELRAELE